MVRLTGDLELGTQVSPKVVSFNFGRKLIDTTIRSEGQKTLYKQFMNESKARNAGLKFDLMRAQ